MSIFSDVAQLRQDQDAALAELKALRASVEALAAAAAVALHELQAIHKCVCPEEIVGIGVDPGTPIQRK